MSGYGAGISKKILGAQLQSTWEEVKKSLPMKENGTWPLYFIPYDKMSDKHKAYYKDDVVDYDDEAADVEDVLGDITSLRTSSDSADAELQAARLENIRMRTKVLR